MLAVENDRQIFRNHKRPSMYIACDAANIKRET